jgi:hypothetical protein
MDHWLSVEPVGARSRVVLRTEAVCKPSCQIVPHVYRRQLRLAGLGEVCVVVALLKFGRIVSCGVYNKFSEL